MTGIFHLLVKFWRQKKILLTGGIQRKYLISTVATSNGNKINIPKKDKMGDNHPVKFNSNQCSLEAEGQTREKENKSTNSILQ